MSENTNANTSETANEPEMPDFTEAWRQWATQSERQWNEFFNQMMSTDEFSQSLGRNLDVFLHFQKTMNEAMGSFFTAMNVPTRTDVLALGDRLLAIENRLATMEALLVAAQAQANAQAPDAAPPARPKRTKRPPSTESGSAASS